jgi:uncharacterized membrane protein YidH (DUF202 family)
MKPKSQRCPTSETFLYNFSKIINMPNKMTRIEIYEEQQLILSKERTILSFMRTGLAFVTAGIVIAGFFGDLKAAQVIGYVLVGIGFIEVFESIRRLISKQKELDELRRKCGMK